MVNELVKKREQSFAAKIKEIFIQKALENQIEDTLERSPVFLESLDSMISGKGEVTIYTDYDEIVSIINDCVDDEENFEDSHSLAHISAIPLLLHFKFDSEDVFELIYFESNSTESGYYIHDDRGFQFSKAYPLEYDHNEGLIQSGYPECFEYTYNFLHNTLNFYLEDYLHEVDEIVNLRLLNSKSSNSIIC